MTTSLKQVAVDIPAQDLGGGVRGTNYQEMVNNRMGHLMGQGMKLSQGKANPAVLKKLFLRELEKSPDSV